MRFPSKVNKKSESSMQLSNSQFPTFQNILASSSIASRRRLLRDIDRGRGCRETDRHRERETGSEGLREGE